MLNEYKVMNWRLLLGDAEYFDDATDLDRDYVLRKAIRFLDRVEDTTHQRHYQARLLLAAHLCPDSALDYDGGSSRPRYELIIEYLTEEFGFKEDQVTKLSKSINRLLESWESGRKSVTSHKRELLEKQEYKCANCHVDTRSTPTTLYNGDPHKPYSPDSGLKIEPEVDHIVPVSTVGTNQIENLQILCKLCNQGKGNGLGVDPGKELEYSGSKPTDIPWHHRASVLYYVILRDQQSCKECGQSEVELTVRPVRPEGGYIQSNLRTLCVDCVDF